MPDPFGAPDPPLEAPPGDLPRAIARTLVAAKKEFYGRGPESAKTFINEDMVITVMRGGKTTAEDTMLEAGQKDMVRAYRQIFQNKMEERLTGAMEQLTGREVVNYQSQVMFDPFTVVELFFFDQPLDEQGAGSSD